MNYKGFSILHSSIIGWYVKVSHDEEWLASCKEDAKKQVDRYLSRSLSIAA